MQLATPWRTRSHMHSGTRAVAREMQTEVVHAILGHASLGTTSTYVRVERRRMLDAAVRYYADVDSKGGIPARVHQSVRRFLPSWRTAARSRAS